MATPIQRLLAWRDAAGDVVASFVEAVNDSDAEHIIRLFAQNAHVNDQLRDFWGRNSIRKWVDREIVGERFRMEVIEAKMHFGDVILSAIVDGLFDKSCLPSPLVLNFIFSLREGEIARLLVLMTRPGEDEPEVRKMAL